MSSKVKTENNLAICCPELVKEWHPTKNKLGPESYPPKSNKKVWWICPKGECGHHEWEARIASRSNGNGCPACSGKIVTPYNNLAVKNSDLAAEWHPTKNALGPEDCTPNSSQKVWWRCPNEDCGHYEWKAIIASRSNGNGCPACANTVVTSYNNLALKRPKLAAEWHPNKNELGPDKYTPGSKYKAWWRCPNEKCGHYEWKAGINDRSIGKGCPACAGKKTTLYNNLAVKNPELAAEWHPTKNERGPEDYTPGSDKKIWWRCHKEDCGHHEWEAFIWSRSKGRGCPACAGKIVTPYNNLAIKNPELAAEWHPTKNKLRPENYNLFSSQKVWWRCPNEECGHHEWEAIINDRSKEKGCPACNIGGYNPSIPGIFYTQILFRRGEPHSVKFGITNRDAELRMKEHSSKSPYDHRLIFYFLAENGAVPKQLEKDVKRMFDSIEHEVTFDGYTETIAFDNLKELKKFVNCWIHKYGSDDIKIIQNWNLDIVENYRNGILDLNDY